MDTPPTEQYTFTIFCGECGTKCTDKYYFLHGELVCKECKERDLGEHTIMSDTNDMLPNTHELHKEFSNEQIDKLWDQARNELLEFANHLTSNNPKITSAQIRLAVQMADTFQQWRKGLLTVKDIGI